jgi:hypothetical protein
MSEQDDYATIGRLVSDRVKAKIGLESVRSNLHAIGDALYRIPECLKKDDFHSAPQTTTQLRSGSQRIR